MNFPEAIQRYETAAHTLPLLNGKKRIMVVQRHALGYFCQTFLLINGAYQPTGGGYIEGLLAMIEVPYGRDGWFDGREFVSERE